MIKCEEQASKAALKHAWKECITVGRGYDLLREDLQRHLRFLQKEIGYKYIRFHASFHDDVGVVHRQKDGSIVYRWTQLDKIYDFIIDAGLKPVFEINPMPEALASGDKKMFWYQMNVTPPAEMQEWRDFIQAWIRHSAERYGINEIRSWFFEVWNEPNLSPGFWTGSQQDYFDLYTACAEVIKELDPQLKVGGPSGADIEWNLDFANYCRDNNVPFDFISYHIYPQNEACKFANQSESPYAPGMYAVDKLKEGKQQLVDNGFGDLPILLTEWNTQAQNMDWKAVWVGNEHVSDLFAGAAVCHLATSCDDQVDMLGWWVASDIFEESGPHFCHYGTGNQYYGMLTADGTPKAAFHAFYFLNKMTGQQYQLEELNCTKPTCNMIVTDELVSTRVLAWNCNFPNDANAQEWNFTAKIPVPKTHKEEQSIRVVTSKVSEGHGSGYEFWKEMGSPANLTAIEQEALRQRSTPEYNVMILPVEDGCVELTVELKINEFIFAELGGELEKSLAELKDDQILLNQQLDV